MESKDNKTSWWKTVPGLIAAISGLITAVGGLIIVIYTVTKDDVDDSSNEEDKIVIAGTSDTTVIIHHAKPSANSVDSFTNTIPEPRSADNQIVPSCTDGILNGNEQGVDCGGDCSPCKVKYRVSVQTSDLKNSGTCENIFIKLIGDDGSHEYRLNTPSNDFQNNAVDIFDFTTIDIGGLRGFLVEMRNSGRCSGIDYDDLHVGRIQIENLSSRETTGWIDVNKWIGDEDLRKLRFSKKARFKNIDLSARK